MPPRRTRSPLERSEGTSPSHDENDLALSKREKTPASTTMANAVAASTPFRQRSASTRARQRSSAAWRAMRPSTAFFCDSIA